MKKVMIISTVGLIYDGITSIIMSCLQSMNLNDMQIYIVSTIQSENRIEEQFQKLGCRIVKLPSRRAEPIKYFIELSSFVRKNKIEVIHAHGNSATLAIEMVAGFLGGCKKRIAHSHNTKCSQVKADRILRPLFYALYTDALACGQEAGEWLFGKRKFRVLKNGRDINRYAYSYETRKAIRDKYQLNDSLAIGHVGAFNEQKNHRFIIDVFREVLKIEPSAKLFLIGDGPLRSNIEEQAEEIKDSIIFIGNTDKVPDYLQAMDVMLLPSLFEGLPLVAVEWQINGLPCILSDEITKDCAFTNTAKFMSLQEDVKEWAQCLIKLGRDNNRENSAKRAQKCINDTGFNISESARQLREIYLLK